MKAAVRAHEYLWDESGWLSEEDKKIISGRWLAHVVGEMASLTRWIVKDARVIFDSYAPRLNSPEFTLPPVEYQKLLRETQRPKEPERPVLSDLDRVIELNLSDITGRTVRTFPGHDENREGANALLVEIIKTGTLMADKDKKRPKPIYEAYRKSISKRDVQKLSSKVTKVQTLKNWGVLWKSFFDSKGIQSLKEVDAILVGQYQAWRDDNIKNIG